MNRILILTLLFLTIVSSVLASELKLGYSIHCEPTAGKFEKGISDWTFTQDIVSVGIMANLLVNEHLDIFITERLIIGSNELGSNIIPIGQKFNTSINLSNKILVLNYSFESYWQNEEVSILYQMCISPVHRLSLDINCPIFSINLF